MEKNNMGTKGSIKYFTTVEINGKAVQVFKECSVKKKEANESLNFYLEYMKGHVEGDDEGKKGETCDFLIIQNDHCVVSGYKNKEKQYPPLTGLILKNAELKDITVSSVVESINDGNWDPGFTYGHFDIKLK